MLICFGSGLLPGGNTYKIVNGDCHYCLFINLYYWRFEIGLILNFSGLRTEGSSYKGVSKSDKFSFCPIDIYYSTFNNRLFWV